MFRKPRAAFDGRILTFARMKCAKVSIACIVDLSGAGRRSKRRCRRLSGRPFRANCRPSLCRCCFPRDGCNPFSRTGTNAQPFVQASVASPISRSWKNEAELKTLPEDVLETRLARYRKDDVFVGTYAGLRRGNLDETFERDLARMYDSRQTPRLSGIRIKALSTRRLFA